MTARLPPPWCRVRDAAERERERKHLADMQWLEKLLKAAGYRLRPGREK